MVDAEVLGGFALLARLTDAQRHEIAAMMTRVTIPVGKRIFSEGDPADACWLIRSGRVALLTETVSESVTVETLGPGDVLGWSWLVPPYRWRFGASAVDTVDALRLEGERLRQLMHRDAAIGYALALPMLEVLAERLSNTRARLLDVYGPPGDH